MTIQDDAAALLEQLREGVNTEAAFLALYRFIDRTPSGRFGWFPLGAGSIYGVDCDDLIARWRDRLRDSIDTGLPIPGIGSLAAIGGVLQTIATTGDITPQSSKQLVLALRTLDAAFRGVHTADVFRGSDLPGFVKLRSKLRKGEPLFEAGDLKVFPRPMRHLQPERRGQNRLSELLDVLTVMYSHPHLRVDYWTAFEVGVHNPEGFMAIGIIPTIQELDELVWSRRLSDRYSIGERDGIESVQDRVRRALDWLAEEGADLVVLPELVSGPGMVNMIKRYLAGRADRGESTPTLLLAGSHMAMDGEFQRNRAVVLDYAGDEVWRQDKMHAYCFTARDQESAGFPLGEDELADRSEDIILEPRKLVVVDASPSQRIAVLICEDFIQEQPHRDLLIDLNITTLLVPIMAPERPAAPPAQVWVTDGAMNYVRHPGATSVVANSGALVRGAEVSEQWQYAEIRSSPRLGVAWSFLPGEAGALAPEAWLARLTRSV